MTKKCGYKETLFVHWGRTARECQGLVSTLHFAHNCKALCFTTIFVKPTITANVVDTEVVAPSIVLTMSPAVEVVAKRRSQ